LSPVQQPDEPHGSAGPAYKQIQTYIQELLDSADYNPGDRIPPSAPWPSSWAATG
jgi:DNA-binding GntR family transcriptional regulator